MERTKILTTGLLSICLFSCIVTDEKQIQDSSKSTYMTEDERIWQIDSCGCLKKRKADTAERIILHYGLVGKDTLAFIKHMGRYNKRRETNKKIIYTYFLDTKCHENSIIDVYADKSWINFDFDKKGRLMGIPEDVCIE